LVSWHGILLQNDKKWKNGNLLSKTPQLTL
jgi:hypothetical protein